ncbi:MAG TPA: metalloregulator ArsR/SmtB family transcription factor [Microthrixaceae bacterium]|jgi:DNA-binding transcriptional ArsR family regulator|nr:metalloregulator ArsR/SmtB family transcription factor [Microthrixaceae bacterium]
MSRAATTSDVFNAIAEPARRDVLGVLARGEQPVGEIVAALDLTQPQVSKHLSVLRTVDLVHCRSHGRQRLYRLNGPALRPVHEWVSAFEAEWNDRLDRFDGVLADLQRKG